MQTANNSDSPPPRRSRRHEMEQNTNRSLKCFLSDLRSDKVAIGDSLLSENDFSRLYNVPLSVARRVFARLKKSNIIRTVPKKGIFLAANFSHLLEPAEPLAQPAAISTSASASINSLALIAYLDKAHPLAKYNATTEYLHIFESECQRHNIRSRLFNLYPNNIITTEMLNNLRTLQPDGLFFQVTSRLYRYKNLQRVLNLQLPLVSTSEIPKFVNANTVGVNEVQSLFLAVNDLVANGHRNIGMIAFKSDEWWMAERITGFRQGLEFNGMTEKPRQLVTLPFYSDMLEKHPSVESIMTAFKGFVGNYSAIICSASIIAKIILEHAPAAGVAIPEDISVIAYGDELNFRHLDMTAVRKPHAEIVKTAFDLLLAQIRNPKLPVTQIRLPGRLVMRSTCKSIKSPSRDAPN